MDQFYLRCIISMYGEVLYIRREQLEVAPGISFDSGTVTMKIRVTREQEPKVPCVLNFHGPAQGSVLVSVRGRPRRCLSCWEHGHVRRFCNRRRDIGARPQERRPMTTLGPVRRDERTAPKTVDTTRRTSGENLISWEEAVSRQRGGLSDLETGDEDIIPPSQPQPDHRSNVDLLMELAAQETEATEVEVIPETQTTIPSSLPDPADVDNLRQPQADQADAQQSPGDIQLPPDDATELEAAVAPSGSSPEAISSSSSTEDETADSNPATSVISPSTAPLPLTPTPESQGDAITISQVTSPPPRSRPPSPAAILEVGQPIALSPPRGIRSTPTSPSACYYTPPSQSLSTPSSSLMQGLVSQTQLFSSQGSDDGFQTVERRKGHSRRHSMPTMVEGPRRGVASRMRIVARTASGMASTVVEAIKRRTTPPGDQPPDKRHQP